MVPVATPLPQDVEPNVIPRPSKGLLACLIGFIAIVFVAHCLYYRPFVGIDDANISQVYAANLAQGHGWVYFSNTERVEGTTSFLQIPIWVLAFWTPFPMAVMHAIHLVFCILAYWTAIRILGVCRASPAPQPVDLAVCGYFCWLGLNPGLTNWMTITLMDSSLWTLLIVAAVYLICRFARDRDVHTYSIRMSAIVGILVLTRPEALALAPLLVIIGGFVSWSWKRSLRAVTPAVALPFAAWLLTAAGLTVYRLLYFGYPLPNTYYAKLSPHFWYNVIGGVKYVVRNIVICPVTLPLLIAAFALLIRSLWMIVVRRETSASHQLRVVVLLPAIALLTIAITNGGDHFAQGRFLAQFNLLLPIPILALITTPAWMTLGRRALWLGVLGVSCGAAIDVLQLLAVEANSDLKGEYRLAETGIEQGDLLNKAFPGKDKPTLGVVMAGGVARSYGGYVIDLLGLNNTAIAHANQGLYGLKNHAAFHRPTFYRLKPDLIFPVIIRTDAALQSRDCSGTWGFEYGVTRGISDEPEFKAIYEPVTLMLKPNVWTTGPDLLTAKPAFLRPLMESAPQPVRGLHIFMKRSLVSSVSASAFDVVPMDCVAPVAAAPVARAPQAGILAWLDNFLAQYGHRDPADMR